MNTSMYGRVNGRKDEYIEMLYAAVLSKSVEVEEELEASASDLQVVYRMLHNEMVARLLSFGWRDSNA